MRKYSKTFSLTARLFKKNGEQAFSRELSNTSFAPEGSWLFLLVSMTLRIHWQGDVSRSILSCIAPWCSRNALFSVPLNALAVIQSNVSRILVEDRGNTLLSFHWISILAPDYPFHRDKPAWENNRTAAWDRLVNFDNLITIQSIRRAWWSV